MSHNNSPPVVIGVLASAAAVSVEAAKIIRDVLSKGELGIVDKGDKNEFDPQTEADRRAQALIFNRLKKDFPKITVIGEEEELDNGNAEDKSLRKQHEDILNIKCSQQLKDIKEEQITVWIDPLDGTTEFTEGIVEAVTILIGIAVDGEAMAGVITQPFPGEGRVLWGVKGHGVGGFKPKTPPKDMPYTVVTTRSHSNKLVQLALDTLAPKEILRVGGAGHKVVLLMEGKAHAYIFASPGCKKWDTCAPEVLLNECGGVLTDVHGHKYKYHSDVQKLNSAGVIATAAGQNQQEVIDKLPQQIKDALKDKV